MNISNFPTHHLLHFKYLLLHNGISSLTKELFCMTTKASNCCYGRMKFVISLQISCNIPFYLFYKICTSVPQNSSLFLLSSFIIWKLLLNRLCDSYLCMAETTVFVLLEWLCNSWFYFRYKSVQVTLKRQ